MRDSIQNSIVNSIILRNKINNFEKKILLTKYDFNNYILYYGLLWELVLPRITLQTIFSLCGLFATKLGV